jgi:hypothetical protein
METTAAAVIALTLLIGGTMIVSICSPTEAQRRASDFRKELKRMCAEQRQRSGERAVAVDAVKARIVTAIAAGKAREILYQKVLDLRERRTATLFEIEKLLLAIYNSALDDLRRLKLPDADTIEHSRRLEQILRDSFKLIS